MKEIVKWLITGISLFIFYIASKTFISGFVCCFEIIVLVNIIDKIWEDEV